MVRSAWSVMFEVVFVSSCEYRVTCQGQTVAHVFAELGLCGGPDYWSVRYRDTRIMPFDTLADAVASVVKRKGGEVLLATPRTPPKSSTTHDYVDAHTEPHSPHCPHCIVAAASDRS